MKTTIVKCDFCETNICDETGKCVFAIHKRVIDGKNYYFCCETHADNFEKESRKKKKIITVPFSNSLSSSFSSQPFQQSSS